MIVKQGTSDKYKKFISIIKLYLLKEATIVYVPRDSMMRTANVSTQMNVRTSPAHASTEPVTIKWPHSSVNATMDMSLLRIKKAVLISMNAIISINVACLMLLNSASTWTVLTDVSVTPVTRSIQTLENAKMSTNVKNTPRIQMSVETETVGIPSVALFVSVMMVLSRVRTDEPVLTSMNATTVPVVMEYVKI